MLNPLYDEEYELDEMEREVTAPLVDTFDIEWWAKVPHDNDINDMKAEELETYLLVREQYLQSRLSELLMDESLEIELNYNSGELILSTVYQCQFNNFLMYNVKYIARMLCAMFNLEYCRYSLFNNSLDFEIFINYIETANGDRKCTVLLDD